MSFHNIDENLLKVCPWKRIYSMVCSRNQMTALGRWCGATIYFQHKLYYRYRLCNSSIPKNEIPHDDVIKWKHFPRYWPFVRGIHRSPVNSPVGATQRPVTRSFDVFFDLCLNKRLSKQSWGWWFETLTSPLWRHRNGNPTWNWALLGIVIFKVCIFCMNNMETYTRWISVRVQYYSVSMLPNNMTLMCTKNNCIYLRYNQVVVQTSIDGTDIHNPYLRWPFFCIR